MKVFKNTVKASVYLNIMLLEHTVALPHDFHVEYVTQWSWISICIEGRDNECSMYFFLTIANRKNSVFNKNNKKTNKQTYGSESLHPRNNRKKLTTNKQTLV